MAADEPIRVTLVVDCRRAAEQLADMQALADLLAVHGDEPDDELDYSDRTLREQLRTLREQLARLVRVSGIYPCPRCRSVSTDPSGFTTHVEAWHRDLLRDGDR